ncbi:MAG: hypothetical protein BSOLF_2238 [Candidatus Carbobacillus altaicus]|uniref:Uncharacterized protein n=1 Tax=Candidatus Carbonibacillus altaicus TaxID=2163959 RepID=A0A2R6Y331_9BACL|nr:MAG: hypothetical protein BSOLF_2238 [Candidatus Carbobacillus altaicus]
MACFDMRFDRYMIIFMLYEHVPPLTGRYFFVLMEKVKR